MRKLSIGVLVLCMLHLGVSSPQEPGAAKESSPASKGSKTQSALAAVATPQAVGDQIVKFFGRKTGKELMAERVKSVATAGAGATQMFAAKPEGKSSKVSTVKPGYVPPPPKPRTSVPQIRQEIQKILELNKKIQSVQSGRSSQLQRVQEQARIHQKILNELETSQKQVSSQKAPTKSALLAQEKLRIIHEETQRNAQMISELEGMPAKTENSAEKAKTSAS
ncbi:MAG TPA: hypothetical protein PKV84_02620 [Candidatus Omnitrophota bacterium]|nr:hypothetical protein [Candidatus Omnitrophota bacterium]